MSKDIKAFCQPDSKGFFGAYGGQYVPDAIKARLDELDQAFKEALADPEFTQEMQRLLLHFAGRPSPVFHCRNLSKKLGGAQIWLKREDLNHLGAHKVNNTIGQCLLAKRMGKTRVIAETGAGQHGVGTAASAALMGLECVICMGEVDVVRQHLNVTRMEMLGARVHTAMSGQRTLKEAVDEALEMWVNEPETFYVLGSAVGLFSGFVHDEGVRLIGVEPGGRGNGYGQHAASLCYGEPGVLHGFNSYMIKNDKGEAGEVYSISAGLDYPSVGPELAELKDAGRAEYVSITDEEALQAFYALSRNEGILPALESSHALAHAMKLAPTMDKDAIILVNLSGRGDKDVAQVADLVNSGAFVPAGD